MKYFFRTFILISSLNLFGEIRLPKLIGDNMVLQRDIDLKIWGWATAGTNVNVNFMGNNYEATVSKNGKWQIILPPMDAGGPYSMTIEGDSSDITISNILIGDVWLASGQSNMVHYLELHKDRYQDEIENANYPQIRQFLVPQNEALVEPVEDYKSGDWKEANPENVMRFSVVAYFFAKHLYEQYKVPIGIINASVGGSSIEAWTSEEGLKPFPEVRNTIQANKDPDNIKQTIDTYNNERNNVLEARPPDEGMVGNTKWMDPALNDNDWKSMAIPGYWEDQGLRDLDGIVWFRRTVTLPESMIGKRGRIHMGRIIDADEIYINGTMVGNKTYQYPQRIYEFGAGVLKPGENIIAIKVRNDSGKGGFVPDKPYYLSTPGDTVDLTGYWKFKVGSVFSEPLPSGGITMRLQPTVYFNGMIAPALKMPLKGVIWYQGESNVSNYGQYDAMTKALIEDWRRKWNQPEMPFLYVQLPNFLDVNYLPEESAWASMREAQRKSLEFLNTRMAVAIDLGEWNDIHPGNKKPIGDRLALAARNLVYDEELVYSGPLIANASVSAERVTLEFDHVGSGLISNDGAPLRWFALAGEDGEFHWAEAKISGDKIELSSSEVSDPLYVRYAWADNPRDVNFYNKEGLPAAPFQFEIKN